MDARTLDDIPRHKWEKGWHTEVSSPHLFIDTCVQIWPDAEFGRLNRYGVTAYLQTTFLPFDDALKGLDAMADWWRVAHTYPEIRIALTASDIEAAHAAKQAAIILGTQGGDFLGQELTRLEMFQRMGLRVVMPVYNARNALADGCLEPGNAGLSRLGKRFVAECNRLGLVIDCTHVGERSTLDIMELSAQPVLFTHSNPKKLCDLPRNITDEQIRRCAAGGGVVGACSWAPLLLRPEHNGRPTLKDFIDAIAYIADLVGVDHVGIGTDMSHGTYPDGDRIRGKGLGGRYDQIIEGNPRSRLRAVEGFDDWGQVPDVTAALSARGFSPAEVDKIMGGNFLRVFRKVWGG